MFPRQQLNYNTEERCFLRGRCQGVIGTTGLEFGKWQNIWDVNLAVVKLTTVQVPELPLWHKLREIGMICSVKPVMTEDLCVVQKEEFSITCYMCDTYIWRRVKHIQNRQTYLLVREEVIWGLWPQGLGWNEFSGLGSQGAWRQEELIGSKQPVGK
jgi:hypothetical protein